MSRSRRGVEGAAVVEYLLVAFAIATLVALLLVAVGSQPPSEPSTACPATVWSITTGSGGGCT